jgi:hypothetical protein
MAWQHGARKLPRAAWVGWLWLDEASAVETERQPYWQAVPRRGGGEPERGTATPTC